MFDIEFEEEDEEFNEFCYDFGFIYIGNYLLRDKYPSLANNFNDKGERSLVILSNLRSPVLH